MSVQIKASIVWRKVNSIRFPNIVLYICDTKDGVLTVLI